MRLHKNGAPMVMTTRTVALDKQGHGIKLRIGHEHFVITLYPLFTQARRSLLQKFYVHNAPLLLLFGICRLAIRRGKDLLLQWSAALHTVLMCM